MTNKFVSVMERVGHDIKVAFLEVVKYLPAAGVIAAAIFTTNPTAAGVVTSVELIRNAVVLVEQKFAATGALTGTGPQKLAEVITLVGPAVTQLLTQEGMKVDQTQLTSIINAVVADLNAETAS